MIMKVSGAEWRGAARRSTAKEEIMCQRHAVFRLGDYRTPELDVAPALGITLIVAVIGLIIRTEL